MTKWMNGVSGTSAVSVNTNFARRTELNLSFQNVAVPEDINLHLLSVTYTDEEEGRADDLRIEYEDRENNLLGTWIDIKPIIQTDIPVEKTVAPENVINHVVQRGDTLWSIAARYLGSGAKYTQIVQENNIANPNLIYPGQVFKITTGGAVESTIAGAEQAPAVALPRLVSAFIVQKNWDDTGQDVTLNAGTFEIDSIEMSGPPDKVTIKSTSIPYTSTLRMEKKSRAWENCNLQSIAIQIAMENGLQCMYASPYNPIYKRKEQVQTSDIRFLQELCRAAGMALKITMMTVVIYDAAEYDSKPAVKTFTKGDANILSYKFSTSLTDTAYTSCHVSYTDPDTKITIEYTFTPDSTVGTGQILEINEKVRSTEEAVLLAQKRLREKNTQEYTASLKIIGDVTMVAGVTVNLQGFQQFDRKYKITQAKHNLLHGYTVDLALKQVLEGY